MIAGRGDAIDFKNGRGYMGMFRVCSGEHSGLNQTGDGLKNIYSRKGFGEVTGNTPCVDAEHFSVTFRNEVFIKVLHYRFLYRIHLALGFPFRIFEVVVISL